MTPEPVFLAPQDIIHYRPRYNETHAAPGGEVPASFEPVTVRESVINSGIQVDGHYIINAILWRY